MRCKEVIKIFEVRELMINGAFRKEVITFVNKHFENNGRSAKIENE